MTLSMKMTIKSERLFERNAVDCCCCCCLSLSLSLSLRARSYFVKKKKRGGVDFLNFYVGDFLI